MESESKLFWLHCRSCSYAVDYQCISGIVYCKLHHTHLNSMSCCENHQPQILPMVIEINRILDDDKSNLEKLIAIFNLIDRIELKYLTKE